MTLTEATRGSRFGPRSPPWLPAALASRWTRSPGLPLPGGAPPPQAFLTVGLLVGDGNARRQSAGRPGGLPSMASDPRATVTAACSCPVAGRARSSVCVTRGVFGSWKAPASARGFPLDNRLRGIRRPDDNGGVEADAGAVAVRPEQACEHPGRPVQGVRRWAGWP